MRIIANDDLLKTRYFCDADRETDRPLWYGGGRPFMLLVSFLFLNKTKRTAMLNEMTVPLMPREKLLAEGATALTDAELLAIFLRTGIKGMPVLMLAQYAIDYFGSLRGLLNASLDVFCEVKGLRSTQYIQLQACKELIKRYAYQEVETTDMVLNADTAALYFQLSLEDLEREALMVMFLDSQNHLIKTETLFYGSLNQLAIYPREIIRAALKYNAAGIIIGHNHPSGCSEPSDADRELTYKLDMACEWVDIRLMDHLIIGKGGYYSFKTMWHSGE